MRNKAFLFDMDGVLADTVKCWDEQKPYIFSEIFGPKISEQLLAMNWRGKHILEIYKAGMILGYSQSEQTFLAEMDRLAKNIYAIAQLSEGLEDLLNWLSTNQYKIAVVTSSQEGWMNTLIARISNSKLISLKLSVHADKHLKPKPAPDGYNYAMQELEVKPEDSYVLEDSGVGIQSALQSGAHAIWFSPYKTDINTLPPGASFQAKSMFEVQKYLQSLR